MTDTSLSLLDRVRRRPDTESWQELVDVYTPLLTAWIRGYDALQPSDVDDLVQEVLLAVSREIERFEHQKRPGAFRAWLRAILVNRLRNFWRSRQRGQPAIGGSDFQKQLNELSDSGSVVSQLWDHEHDRCVMAHLLRQIEPKFAANTWEAFRRQVLQGQPAAEVSVELGMPLHSVYAAKSRVIAALRSEAAGLIE